MAATATDGRPPLDRGRIPRFDLAELEEAVKAEAEEEAEQKKQQEEGKQEVEEKEQQDEEENEEEWRLSPAELEFSERLRSGLEEHGCAIVQNAMDEESLQRAEELFWEWAASTGLGIDKERPETMRNEVWSRLGFVQTGVMTNYSIGQSDFLHYCREHAGKRVFSLAWQCAPAALVTSYDGCGVFRNPTNAPSDEEWLTQGGWYHVDQNWHREPGFELWQGLLHVTPRGNQYTGSNVVVPGSHKRFAEIFEYAERNTQSDFVRVNKPGDAERFLGGAVQSELQPGDMMLWDSRTVHCSCGGKPGATQKQVGTSGPLSRCVAYVCQIPRDELYRRGGNPNLRRECVERGFTTSHDPVVREKTLNRRRAVHPDYVQPAADRDDVWGLN